MDSPSIQIILKQIDNAMLNIAEKEFCATKFVVLDTKLKELKNYVISCKGLPSFKVSILLTLCTFIRAISKRKTSRNGANAIPGPTRKTKPFEGKDRRNSLEGINSPSTTEATNSPPKKKKKLLIAMISKKMKTKKAKGQNKRDAHEDILPPSPTEVITSSPKKEKKSLMAKISKNMKKIKRRSRVRNGGEHLLPDETGTAGSSAVVDAVHPVGSSEMNNRLNESGQSSSKGGKGIDAARFRQVVSIIDILTSENPTYNYSVMVLREIDFILLDLKREEVSKGWFIRMFGKESKLLRLLKPTVKEQWQPILFWVRLLLLPIVIPLVCFAYTKFHRGEIVATLFMCLLDASMIVLPRNKDPSQQIVVDSVLILSLWLMVKHFILAAFAFFTLLFFSDVPCKQIAYFIVMMTEKISLMIGRKSRVNERVPT
uniref:Uncharacterized protein n=1 Tax=Ditylum brightwellii TaxID=49249 RepID=A0A7S4S8H9_9STRA